MSFTEYTTMPNPTNEKEYIIAECMVFGSLGAFIHVDLFRGLIRDARLMSEGIITQDAYEQAKSHNFSDGDLEITYYDKIILTFSPGQLKIIYRYSEKQVRMMEIDGWQGISREAINQQFETNPWDME